MSVDDQFGESENLPAEMEGVAESRLLSLFRRQRLHRLQIEVVVQMQVVQILSVNQQIQHVVALSQHLKTIFYFYLDVSKFGEKEDFRLLRCFFFLRIFSTSLFFTFVNFIFHLQSRLHPIQIRRLEELGRFERPEQISPFLRFGRPMFERIQYEHFEQLLVRDSHFHGHSCNSHTHVSILF